MDFVVYLHTSVPASRVAAVQTELDRLAISDVDFNGVNFVVCEDPDFTWVCPPDGFDEYHASRLLNVVQTIIQGGAP